MVHFDKVLGRGLIKRWDVVISILLGWTSRSGSGIHDSTLMCSRELTLDLFPSPFRRLDRSSGEVSVGSGFFDELRDPFSTVVLRNFAVGESVCKIAVELLAVSYQRRVEEVSNPTTPIAARSRPSLRF